MFRSVPSFFRCSSTISRCIARSGASSGSTRLRALPRKHVGDEWDDVSVDDKDDDIFKIKRIALDDGRDLIDTWSSRRAAHYMKVLEDRWAKANKLLDKGACTVSASFSHGSLQFVKAGRGNEYSTNDALYEKRKKYAGYYALSTSCADMPSSEVYANLRQLRCVLFSCGPDFGSRGTS